MNIRVYLVYGTLLGIIRENDFLEHDTDIDMAYLSNYHTKEEVIQEFNEICKVLETTKALLHRIKTMSHIHVQDTITGTRLDMWISWIDENNNYHIVWTVAGEIDASMILPFKTVEFRKQVFRQMNDPERFLNEHYNTWKVPVGGEAPQWAKRKFVFELEPWQGK